jgi:predicted DNA-binding transcriptional regulator AlpA
MDDRLLTLDEVAAYLRLPPASLHRQRYVGQPPGSLGFRVGRHVRFRRIDIERWIDEQVGPPEDPRGGGRGR